MKALLTFSTQGEGDIARVDYHAQTDKQQEFMRAVLLRKIQEKGFCLLQSIHEGPKNER